MKGKRYRFKIPFITVSIVLVTLFPVLNGQEKPSRQTSLEAFSNGDYEKAYSGFSELLISYPKDPVYKYYSGVCLIKLIREPEKALKMLDEARQGSAVVRNVPFDVLFWLGRAQQMTGRFNEAIASYTEFTDRFGKKMAKDLEIPVYIQQCNEKKGALSAAASVPVHEEVEPATKNNEVQMIPERPKEEPAADGESRNIRFDFDLILAEALVNQYKADSLYKLTEGWKSGLDKLDNRSRTEMKSKIAETENLATSYQKIADRKYNEAQALMNATSFSRVETGNQDSLVRDDSGRVEEEIPEAVSPVVTRPERKDSVAIPLQRDQAEVVAGKTTDTPLPRESVRAGTRGQEANKAGLYSIFEVTKPDIHSTEKIIINGKVPDGLIYRIQVAVFRNPVSVSYFKGLKPIYGFRAPGKDFTVYYAGMFRKVADARKALPAVRQKGFGDAFITALSDARQISLERAAVLEKEWGNKPFPDPDGPRTPADTVPPELCFRVEVMRSAKPPKDEVIEGMKKIAGAAGLDVEQKAGKEFIYLIGKFITYESALSYSDLLVRNGYRDAKVVARLGPKEVPVETARELFEKVE